MSAAPPEPACEADYADEAAPELWQWCEDGHGADELPGDLWEEPAPVVAAPSAAPVEIPTAPHQEAATEPAPVVEAKSSDESADTPGASYDPKADLTRKHRRASKDPKVSAAEAKRKRRARWQALELEVLRVQFFKLRSRARRAKTAAQQRRLDDLVAEMGYILAVREAQSAAPKPTPFVMPLEDLPASLPDVRSMLGADARAPTSSRAEGAPVVQHQAFIGGAP